MDEPEDDLRSKFGAAHDEIGCGVGQTWPTEYLDAIRKVVAQISYKPDSHFEVRADGDLMLSTIEYDRRTGRRMPMLYNDEAFTARVHSLQVDREMPLDHAVLASFREAVLTEERHEASEWICFAGAFDFDPHAQTDRGLDILVRAAQIGF